MNFLRIILFCTLSAVVCCAQDQLSKPQQATATGESSAQNGDWPQEPISFIKVRFGKPLLDSYPLCPRERRFDNLVRYEWWSPGLGPCVEPHDDFNTVHNIAPFGEGLFVLGTQDEVDYVSATFKRFGISGSIAETIRSSLIEKFGAPHQRTVEHVQTNAGFNAEREVLIWRGKIVTIRFSSIGSHIDEGYVEAFTRSYTERTQKLEKNNTNTLRDTF